MQYNMREEDKKWLEEIWNKLQVKMESETKRMGNKIPYIAVNGVYEEDKATNDPDWWTNGFWAGIMWQMYHATGNEIYKDTARESAKVLNTLFTKMEVLHHDVGFMWLHTGVADYRLTGNEEAKKDGLAAANILASRYNPSGKFIRAWNGEDNIGWMIIDCMMNIPILHWATEETKDPRYKFVADAHAETTLKYEIRQDGSSNHIVIMDPHTGEFLDAPAGQGYAPGSSWTRGQAWAIYGTAINYRNTKEMQYLDAAKRIAHYFMSAVSLTDYVPLIDFRQPKEPVLYDTTAGLCAACGLLEISEHVDELEKDLYIQSAIRLLKAIEEKYGNWDPNYDSIIGGGSEAYHGREKSLHVPIIYGDYFFIEGILKLLGKEFFIW